jgi:hypothetical protein
MRRSIAGLIVVIWALPWVIAADRAQHRLTDHAPGSRPPLAGAFLTAVHGHWHDDATPEHGHDLRIVSRATPQPPDAGAPVPAIPESEADGPSFAGGSGRLGELQRPRAGPLLLHLISILRI